MKKIFENIESKIKQYQNIVIFHHIKPDGDCLGSQFGLKYLIQDNFKNKNIYAIGNSDNLFPFLDFKMDFIPNEEILKKSLGIVVDANYLERIQEAELIRDKKLAEIIRIDHHPVDDDLEASLVFKDDSYAAAAEQIGDLAITLNWKISPKSAEFIYLGIVTDSGRFLFNKTSKRTFYIASKLLESNFNLDLLNLNLSKKSLLDIDKSKFIFDNYKIYKNIIYLEANNELLEKNNLDIKISNYINILSNIDNFYVWIFFIEDKAENNIRVRLRSNGPNIFEVAKKFNGGGHFRASGAKINSFYEVREVLKECNKAIIKWLKENNVSTKIN